MEYDGIHDFSFAGAVLMCPMLTVSDEVKPPWIVQQFFKHVVAPLMPSWPITPSVETWQQHVENCGECPCLCCSCAWVCLDASAWRISDLFRLIWVATIVY